MGKIGALLLLLSWAAAQDFGFEERGRTLRHANLQKGKLLGNSTDLEYFYLTVHVGS